MTPTKTTTTKRARPATAAKAAPAKRTAKKKATRPALVDLVVAALEDLKAQNVTVLDVRGVTDVTDTIVVASGTSDRHVKSLAGSVYAKAKAGGFRPIGMEGEQEGEWVLVDLQDAIVHVMLPRVREFYGLEKLWDVREGSRATG
jgi:ribosome-associated protein